MTFVIDATAALAFYWLLCSKYLLPTHAIILSCVIFVDLAWKYEGGAAAQSTPNIGHEQPLEVATPIIGQ